MPIEFKRTKEDYESAIKRFKNKCLSAIKYDHQCKKYEHELKHEQEEIALLEHEVEDLESMYKNHMEIALKAADFIENFNLENLKGLLSQTAEPKYATIPFQAFLQLGPEGTQGGSDISWNYIRKLIQDKEGLAG